MSATDRNNPSMEASEATTKNIIQACEEVGSLAREQVDATLRSANACWQGCSEINQNLSGLVQESMSNALQASKTMMEAKSLREMMETHAEFMKEFLERWVQGTGRITEISARVTKETMDPLAEHANNTMGKVAQRARAAA